MSGSNWESRIENFEHDILKKQSYDGFIKKGAERESEFIREME